MAWRARGRAQRLRAFRWSCSTAPTSLSPTAALHPRCAQLINVVPRMRNANAHYSIASAQMVCAAMDANAATGCGCDLAVAPVGQADGSRRNQRDDRGKLLPLLCGGAAVVSHGMPRAAERRCSGTHCHDALHWLQRSLLEMCCSVTLLVLVASYSAATLIIAAHTRRRRRLV